MVYIGPKYKRLMDIIVALQRTTNSSGQIKEREWYGEKGMQHVRTTKEPRQAIPTFAETVALLMRVRRSFFHSLVANML